MTNKVMTVVLALASIPCFAQSNLLQITSPASGTVVYPNQVVVISVYADPSVSDVAIVGAGPLGFSQTTNGQPLQFQLTIPSYTPINSYNISAVGATADGSLVASPAISLQVDTPNTQFQIQTEPSVLRFSAPGQTVPLHVIGTFGDGSQLDMTHSVQMSYFSQNPQIATVDGQGLVTAVAPGSTNIVTSNTMYSYSYFVSTTVGQLAMIYSPGNATMLSSSSETFYWNGSSTATAYRLEVGSVAGGDDYYESGSLPTTTLSQTVTGLPINDQSYNNIYVTLSTEINGQWASNQYNYILFYEPDFTITPSPSSLTILQGQPGTSTITTTISGLFGLYQSPICLSASGLPSGATASFNPSAIPQPGAGGSTLTLSVGNSTPVGTYPITVTGFGGWIQHTTTITLTVSAGQLATMTSPISGSMLPGSSVTFQWNGSSTATAYWIDVGSTQGGNNYYQSGSLPTTTLSQTVTGLPIDGSQVYVTLWSLVNGQWFNNQYTYTAFNPAGQLGVMQTPTPGSILTGSSQLFTWTAGSGATAYWIDAGSTPVGNQYFQSGNIGNVTSYTVTGLPINGSQVYVTLWSLVNGQWVNNQYTYTAFNPGGQLGVMQTPTPGSQLTTNSVTFTWTAGTGGATAYWLDLGTTPAGNDIYQSGSLNALTATAPNVIPSGETVYATLYSLLGGQWVSNPYTYMAAPGAIMQSPAPGSTLSGSSATFSWSAGGSGITQYQLTAGSTYGGSQWYSSGTIGTQSATATGLPADGSTIYVTVASLYQGNWLYNYYSYISGP